MRRRLERAERRGVSLWLPLAAVSLVVVLASGCQEQPEPAPVVVGQTPQPQMIPDSDISEAVQYQLLLSKAVPAHRINISTSEGIVTLTGSVDNLRALERAVAVAEGIKGVRAVVNRVEVQPVQRTDEQIKEEVQEALQIDPVTVERKIEVTVADGVVTLSGTVSSWPVKQLAQTVAKGVRGVKAINDQLTIAYAEPKTDEEIARAVEARLRRDLRVDAALITVEVQDGQITLDGTVGSAAERSRAAVDAWVPGVQAVDPSGLEVRWWARDEMRRKYVPIKTDQELRQAINDALFYDPRVASFEPEVQVEGGVVTLSGTVGNLMAKIAAEQDVRNTVGVVRVKNLLTVRPETTYEAEALVARISRALERDPVLGRYEIDVTVVNGEAFLWGKVPSRYDRELAEEVVAHVPGVIAVANNLEVNGPLTLKSDWEILEDINDELFWSPYVDADEVTVVVDDGVATLTGQVDTWMERWAAAENAREGGAIWVRNEIEVESR